MTDTAPILIFGVPRSGTTLLRTLLDAHPAIAAGPEAPWLAEHQPRSVLGLARYLAEHPQGFAANFGATRDEVFVAVRALVDQLMAGYAQRRGKQRWAHKTPNDVLHIEALLELLPDARILWIVRDGMDVAVSTTVTAEHRRGMAPLYEKKLRLAPDVMAPSSPAMALIRWGLWNHRIRRGLEGRQRLFVRYEDLVRAPEPTLRAICDFVGEPFDNSMLRYETTRHDLPAWEWGSADVRAHGEISPDRAGRGQRELDEAAQLALAPLAAQDFAGTAAAGRDRPGERGGRPAAGHGTIEELARLLNAAAAALGADALGPEGSMADLRRAMEVERDAPFAPDAPATLAPLVAAARGAEVGWLDAMPAPLVAAIRGAGVEPAPDGGGHFTTPSPRARLASLHELRSRRFRGFMDELNTFARQHKLREMQTWSKIWEYPWIWFNALAQIDWRGKRVIDLGSEISPMPWLLAQRGAEVLLVEADSQWVQRWERVQRTLGTSVRWSIVSDERIEAPDGWADLVLSFSVIEHQPQKRRAVDEAVRVLKPGGVFALSFDICEPSLQMTFPEWNGRALTIAEFEREIWRHPALDPGGPPQWNREDIPGFLTWHRGTAEHHNYVTGAAVLVRR